MVRTSGNWLRAGNARCSTIPLSPDWVHAAGELETTVDDAAASLAAKPDAEKIQRQPAI